MSKLNEPNLDKQIDEILKELALYLTSVAEISPFETINQDKEEVKKNREAIKALIANQVREARIDELNQVMGNLHDNRDCTTCYSNHTKLERHYAELQSTQPSNTGGDDK